MFMHYLEFLHLNTKCTNMESSLTKYPLEHKTKAKDHKREAKQGTWNKRYGWAQREDTEWRRSEEPSEQKIYDFSKRVF